MPKPPPCPPPPLCCMPRPCSMLCSPIGTPYHKMPRKLLGCHVQNEEYLPLADVKENDNEDAADEAYDGNSGKEKAEVIKQRLEEQNEELKEEIKKMSKQWKKLKRIILRTQSEQLNGSSGDGSPAPRSEPNQMQPPRFSLKIECEVGDTVERGKSIPVKVDLYDDGNLIATSHPLASAKVMIVVLKRKFNNSRHSWSKVDFEASIVRPRLQNSTIGDVNQGIQSIVNNCVFKLDGGTGRHSGATIWENSGNKKVKLGVMVLPDDSYGEYKNERVLEGVSEERFIVREQLDPPRTSKKQKEAVEPFRSPSAEQAPVGCGQERNGPTLNRQLQLQADTNMPSSSSTPRDNTLGADQQLPVEPSTNRQPSSFSEGHQTPVISDSTNQTMHNPDGDVQMDSVLEDLHQMGNPIGYFEPQLNNEPICRVRRLSLEYSSNEGGGGVAKEIDWSSLMSLMICSSYIFDFKDYKLLRVLDLEGCNGLSERVLDVICKLPFLRYPSPRGSDVPRIPKNPKPQVSRDGFSGSSFVVDRDGFPSLQRLCFEAPKLPLLQIEQGAMTKLTSLQMLCQEFADGLGVTGIEHLQRLDEVILHSSASDAVMEHQNRPSVKKQQINDAA